MAELAIARDMSAKFKAFSFPVIKSYSVVPVFRSSVLPLFRVFQCPARVANDGDKGVASLSQSSHELRVGSGHARLLGAEVLLMQDRHILQGRRQRYGRYGHGRTGF